ncbi:hypothetical protein FQV39_25655 [Bosea sp. F3-2]|uniref:hypothetical protein n=1 Tax=Bosea sp. F3-2 TaxID=2599640 RepID=UPI0011EC0DEE|nr:hypothetical protein [Bosea sp. F3-2]QEL25606.1 hypothetical protein FQV39_25655 [Bosea sp. F3-2]
MDDPIKAAAKDDPLYLDPALREKAKRWFAEAREQTKRDDEESPPGAATPARPEATEGQAGLTGTEVETAVAEAIEPTLRKVSSQAGVR